MSSPPCRDVLVICRGVAIYLDQNPETVGTLSRSGPGFFDSSLYCLDGKDSFVLGLRLRPGKTGVGGSYPDGIGIVNL